MGGAMGGGEWYGWSLQSTGLERSAPGSLKVAAYTR